MIDKQTAKKYVAKLWQMKNFPRESEAAVGELVLAMECADTEIIAKRATEHFLELADPDTLCPMPKNIREVIYGIQEPAYEAPRPPRPQCTTCYDDGVIGGFAGGADAVWCECEAGNAKRIERPGLVGGINESKRTLERIFGKKQIPRLLTAQAAKERRDLRNVTQILGAIDGGK